MGTFLRFRPKPRRYARESLTTNIDTLYLQPVLNVLFGVRNGAHMGQAAFADTVKTVDGIAVASGSSVTLWTPAAGNVAQVIYMQFWTSGAGIFQVLYNAVGQQQEVMAVNVTVRYNFGWPGVFYYPVGQSLTIKNASGAASDIHGLAIGAEILG